MLSKIFGAIAHGPALSEMANTSEALDGLRELDRLYGRLCKTEDDYVDTASEAGYRACQEFLQFAASVADTFKQDPVSRAYRSNFSVNYRMLFPNDTRSYRVDLLGASAGQCAMIWVNGAKFEFSPEAVRLAGALQEAWVQFCACLQRRVAFSPPVDKDGVLEVRSFLSALDRCWAGFEFKYITELMEIEDRARDIVVDAVKIEESLQRIEAETAKLHTKLEDGCATSTAELCGVASAALRAEFVEGRRSLVTCIARLNSVANFNRKGRDDIDAEVLESAIATLRECNAGEASSPKAAEERNVAVNLATDVLDSFQAMREYLSEVKSLISRVDPHLRNNPGLVARLVDFEETWEIGARYVCNADVMDEVCGLVAEVRFAARVVPSLATMVNSCAVEIFLCLPRIAWLRYLAGVARKHREPSESLSKARRGRNRGRAKTMPTGGVFGAIDKSYNEGTGIVRTMLPQRFDSPIFSDGLDALVEKFEKARCCIQEALHQQDNDIELATRLVLLRRAAAGSGDLTSDDYRESLVQGPARDVAVAAIEELMHDLEAYSMELQRHCPEDWNQCAAVLVQQLTEGEKKDRRPQFRV
jgi:hypothetical protein